jgi:toxin-antitoxin system PIN domain toxin
VLLDANLLLYAVDESSPQHEAAAAWLTEQLNGPRRVGLPWTSLTAFLRIASHPRASDAPLDAEEAWSFVADWLRSDVAWTPAPTDRHPEILGGLIRRHRITGNLVPDAHLAALAIEHGLALHSCDSDFARFPEITWIDPLRS